MPGWRDRKRAVVVECRLNIAFHAAAPKLRGPHQGHTRCLDERAAKRPGERYRQLRAVYAGCFDHQSDRRRTNFLSLTRHCSMERRQWPGGSRSQLFVIGTLLRFVCSSFRHQLGGAGRRRPRGDVLAITGRQRRRDQQRMAPSGRSTRSTSGAAVDGRAWVDLLRHHAGQSAGTARRHVQLAPLVGGAVTGLVAIALTIFLSYRFAERIIAVRPRGTSVISGCRPYSAVYRRRDLVARCSGRPAKAAAGANPPDEISPPAQPAISSAE